MILELMAFEVKDYRELGLELSQKTSLGGYSLTEKYQGRLEAKLFTLKAKCGDLRRLSSSHSVPSNGRISEKGA